MCAAVRNSVFPPNEAQFERRRKKYSSISFLRTATFVQSSIDRFAFCGPYETFTLLRGYFGHCHGLRRY
jgi:hypothetical protein